MLRSRSRHCRSILLKIVGKCQRIGGTSRRRKSSMESHIVISRLTDSYRGCIRRVRNGRPGSDAVSVKNQRLSVRSCLGRRGISGKHLLRQRSRWACSSCSSCGACCSGRACSSRNSRGPCGASRPRWACSSRGSGRSISSCGACGSRKSRQSRHACGPCSSCGSGHTSRACGSGGTCRACRPSWPSCPGRACRSSCRTCGSCGPCRAVYLCTTLDFPLC